MDFLRLRIMRGKFCPVRVPSLTGLFLPKYLFSLDKLSWKSVNESTRT